jgi:hypothetical protein
MLWGWRAEVEESAKGCWFFREKATKRLVLEIETWNFWREVGGNSHRALSFAATRDGREEKQEGGAAEG